ncbi:hypothetical protein LUZ60_002759 [Juncus effusus]|nr:hypothetical protein LUZ60_002759 [Juncus effusus]
MEVSSSIQKNQMAFPLQWFPPPNLSGDASPAHNLGGLVRRRFSDHLRLLLRSRSEVQNRMEAFRKDTFLIFHDLLHKAPNFMNKNPKLEMVDISISVPWLSLFAGKGPKKLRAFGRNDKSQFKNIQRGNSNKRLWTNILLAVNVLAYVAQVATQGKLLMWGAKVNSLIQRGQIWRLATSAVLHANVVHLMVNCYSLNSIGPVVEQLGGPKRFLTVYFTSALASSLMSYKYCQSPAVGASGAIFGLVGAFAVFITRHRKLIGGAKNELQHIAQVIVLNMVIGLGTRGIDNWGHLGGLLGGAAISWLVGPAWQYEFRSKDGRLVFTDRSPIFRLIDPKKFK